MDAHTFDAFTRQFSRSRATRRTAIGAMVTSFAVAALSGPAAAQVATPTTEDDAPEFLFVQLADRGAWVPSPNEPGVFLLTLTGATSQTIFFSDRPQRIVGTVPTPQLLGTLGFTPDDPPNAAIVAHDETGQRDVLVVELFDPVIQQEFGDDRATTMIYKARVLDAFAGPNLDEWQAAQQDDQLAHEFTDVSLFIDDCPDLNWCNGFDASREYHVRSMGPLPSGSIGTCWNIDLLDCVPCNGAQTQFYYDLCNRDYPECNGTCKPQYSYHP